MGERKGHASALTVGLVDSPDVTPLLPQCGDVPRRLLKEREREGTGMEAK